MCNQEMELEKAKVHLETLRQIIWARYSIISTTSMLSAAILVIATFNPQLLALSLCATKILVVILLALIPISLIDFSLRLNKDATHVMKHIDPEWEKDKGNIVQRIWDASSYIYVMIITLLIGFIIYSIIKTL